jgi:ferredoxin
MLYIDPDTCIDCGACEPVCPVQAIFPLEELPADQEEWEQINIDKCASGELENITEMEDPLPGAEERKTALGF